MSHQSGCLLCGADLVYQPVAETMTCAVCSKEFPSTAACSNGHFVCDACHSLGALDWIEARCRGYAGRDPLALAGELMAHPGVKMHGPEHHFLFPAALAAAYANATGQPEAKAVWLPLIRQRSSAVPGGFCGFQGACGAGIGMGIFSSVVEGATPVSGAEWGRANALTAKALLAIAAEGGPRCCKRDGWLALGAAMGELTARGVAFEGSGRPVCTFMSRNKECRGPACPFHPQAAAA